MSLEKFQVKSSISQGFLQTFLLKLASLMMKASPTLSQASPTKKPFSNIPSKKLPSLSYSLPRPVLHPFSNSPRYVLLRSCSTPNPHFSPFLKVPSKPLSHFCLRRSQYRIVPFPLSKPLFQVPCIILIIFCPDQGCDTVQSVPFPWQESDAQLPQNTVRTLAGLRERTMPQSPCLMVSTRSPKQSYLPSERCSWRRILHLSQKQRRKGQDLKQGSYWRKMLCLNSEVAILLWKK